MYFYKFYILDTYLVDSFTSTKEKFSLYKHEHVQNKNETNNAAFEVEAIALVNHVLPADQARLKWHRPLLY